MTKIDTQTGQIKCAFLDEQGRLLEISMNGPDARELSQELLRLADNYDRNLEKTLGIRKK